MRGRERGPWPCFSCGLMLGVGLFLTCMVRVQPLYAPPTPFGLGGVRRGSGGGAGVDGGVMRLRGGERFEEVGSVDDVVQLPLDKSGNKRKRIQPLTPIEREVAGLLFMAKDLPGLRMLKYLHVVSAMEISLGKSGERAIVVMLPYVEMMEYRKIEAILRPRMEEHFSAHIVWIRHRRILREEKGGKRLLKQKRPMSRSMTDVHNKYLDDIVYPHDVVMKQREYDPGVKLPTHVVFLDPETRDQTEHKLEMYQIVYQKLTARKCYFDYLEYPDGPELERQRAPNIVPADAAGYEKIHFKAVPLLPNGKIPADYTGHEIKEKKGVDSMDEDGEAVSSTDSGWEEFPGKVTEGWRPAHRARTFPQPNEQKKNGGGSESGDGDEEGEESNDEDDDKEGDDDEEGSS